MPIRMTGLTSGLDTEAIVSALVSGYRTKKDNYVKAQKKLSWKADAWKDVNTQVYGLYTSISSLRYSSAYTLKKTTVSDTTKATVTASNNAMNGTQTLKIRQIAKAGYLTGANLGSSTSSASTLSNLGYTGGDGTISLTVNGKKTDIAVSGDTTISSFVSSLTSAGVNASYDATNHRIFVAAKDTGAENDFALVGTDSNGLSALSSLGLSVSGTSNTAAYQALAAYAVNSSGAAYISYDSNGKAVTSGTYDADQTKTGIQSILSSLKSAYSDKSTATSENTVLNAELSYANAYRAYEDAMTASGKASTMTQLDTLLDVSKLSSSYVGDDGTVYTSRTYVAGTGGSEGHYVYKTEDGTTYETEDSLSTVSDKITELAKDAGLITTSTDGSGKESTDETAFSTFKTNRSTVKSYEADSANADRISTVQTAYTAGTISDLTSSLSDQIAANATTISDANALIEKYSDIDTGSYDGLDDNGLAELASSITEKIPTAAGVIDGSVTVPASTGATRINGQDAKIVLNGADYTSSSNVITVNGTTITALAETGDSEITISTNTDTQGLYDKIKDFLSSYNDVINNIMKLYNADSASGYEPLTDDEKSAMTDTQVEEWETKIKDSLLRHDTTLNSIISTMTSAMAKGYTVNGKTYALTSFGISTLGYLNAAENENYAYHIDGDSDDDYTSSNSDKLMTALQNDPDTVIDFMKQLTDGLYKSLDNKMKSTSLRSAYTVYNDKEMASEYSDYTDLISEWETRLSDMEDSYYKKFSNMESALSTLNSNSSSISSLLGS